MMVGSETGGGGFWLMMRDRLIWWVVDVTIAGRCRGLWSRPVELGEKKKIRLFFLIDTWMCVYDNI